MTDKNLFLILNALAKGLPARITLEYKRTGSFLLTWGNQVQVKGKNAVIMCTYTFKRGQGLKLLAKHDNRIIFSSDLADARKVVDDYRTSLSRQGYVLINQVPTRAHHLQCFIQFAKMYYAIKRHIGFELVAGLDGMVVAVDKYTDDRHQYKYNPTANVNNFAQKVQVQSSKGTTLYAHSLDDIKQYISTGEILGEVHGKITPQDNTLHVIVEPSYSTIKAKWFILHGNRLQEVTESVYVNVKAFNEQTTTPHSTIPYSFKNRFITYPFGCGLTHYLNQDNMKHVIKQFPAQHLRVWTTSDLNMSHNDTNFIAALSTRLDV